MLRILDKYVMCKKNGLNLWQSTYLWLGGLYLTEVLTCGVMASDICDNQGVSAVMTVQYMSAHICCSHFQC